MHRDLKLLLCRIKVTVFREVGRVGLAYRNLDKLRGKQALGLMDADGALEPLAESGPHAGRSELFVGVVVKLDVLAERQCLFVA